MSTDTTIPAQIVPRGQNLSGRVGGTVASRVEQPMERADVLTAELEVARMFYADRRPERVAGLVFVDTIAIPGYVDWFGPTVDDGGSTIDMRRTAKDWAAIGSFGSTPTIVLTQNFQGEDDFVPQRFRRYFRHMHDELAEGSSDSLHVIAVDSGHMIQETSPDLVTAAVIEVIEAVRSVEPLAPCDDRFEGLGGACATPQPRAA